MLSFSPLCSVRAHSCGCKDTFLRVRTTLPTVGLFARKGLLCRLPAADRVKNRLS